MSKTISEKALELIEFMIAEEGDDEDTTKMAIYRLAHTANNPKCRKNHPQWTKELSNTYKELLKAGFVGNKKSYEINYSLFDKIMKEKD